MYGGATTLVAMLLAGAIIVNTTGYYYCEESGTIMKCESLSSTKYSCYWSDESGNHRTYCKAEDSKGIWKSLDEYAKIEPEPSQDKVKVCGREGCFLCNAPIDAYSICEGTGNTAGEIILP